MPSFMDLALDEARKAQGLGEVPVGCVIVRDGAIVATAGNRTLADRDPTAHAEMVAIRAAARELGSERLTGCDLYVTLEPCAMCAAAMSFARIRRLYFGAGDPKGGAVEHGVRFFAAPTCHHRPEVYGGIGEPEAALKIRNALQKVYRTRDKLTRDVGGKSGTKAFAQAVHVAEQSKHSSMHRKSRSRSRSEGRGCRSMMSLTVMSSLLRVGIGS